VVGFKILNIFDDTLDLAEAVYSHHERWDGSGYPKGLKGNEIPVSSRIIAVAEYYDALTNTMVAEAISSEEAKGRLESQAGSKLDPEIVKAFIYTLR
jgi:HD-GYP domain-containing protein (c-di-GMP phosphodiesterase class II)